MAVPRMRLSRAASHSARSGHPWVYREDPVRHPAGTVVDLLDDRGEPLGFGLTDDGPIAVRVLGRGPREPLDGLIDARIRRADRLRRSLVGAGADTDTYRALSGAGDGLDGLVADRYGEVAVLRVYAAAWLPHLPRVIGAIAGLPWCRTVARRFGVERVDGRDGLDTVHGPETPTEVVVTERGMRMLVRPAVGQKTGLFLDQREHRALVRGWAHGRTVANLFAYTGGFSVAAALGGATRVVTVDIAPDAIDDARENFRLNGIDPDLHGFEVADAFEWVSASPQGLLIVDPPSLARDRGAKDAAERAYVKLHRHHGARIASDGLLATSSCTARLSLDRWRASVAEGLSRIGDWSWHWTSTEPPDHPVALGHPEGAYLKFALLSRR